ncbi:hypothetical protein JCM4814A_50580 [Streptomyces phaeofaciens JCM 4814]|uniref:Uncharacterized protein n=1 Tax=Streptomyces phaeofaciens TaxID=68254 RepID=A0A918HP30_9ACTN|nr:hypothetical protein GCM10010226_77730 [Streptomyces phaeofaciens]
MAIRLSGRLVEVTLHSSGDVVEGAALRAVCMRSRLEKAPYRGAGLYRHAAPPRGAAGRDGAAERQRPVTVLTAERRAVCASG